MLTNTKNGYGLIAIALHWVSAFAVIGLFALGYWMVDLSYYSEWYRTGPHIHKSVGLLLLAATLLRIIWKLSNQRPTPAGDNKVQNTLSSLVHIMLYVLLLFIMITGYLISTADGRGIDVFDWFTLPAMGELFTDQEDIAGLLHEYAAYTVIGFALLHGLAALKHHLFDRDNTLIRMIKPTKY